MTNKPPPPSSSSVSTYQLPLQHFSSNSIGLTTKTLIQPAYTRNLSFFSLHSFPFSSSALPHYSERQVPFRRLAELPLFYGKYCDPTSSLRGDQHLRGLIEPLIWSSLLSQPFLEFSSKLLGRTHHGKPRHKCDSLCPWNRHHVWQWRHWWGQGYCRDTVGELLFNPATWKPWKSKYSEMLQTVLTIFKRQSFPCHPPSSETHESFVCPRQSSIILKGHLIINGFSQFL